VEAKRVQDAYDATDRKRTSRRIVPFPASVIGRDMFSLHNLNCEKYVSKTNCVAQGLSERATE
jgi:hypothetical protein